MTAKAIMFAPKLVDLVGHEFQYTNVVAEAFKRRGYEVVIYGARDAVSEVRAIDGFIPAFRKIDRPKDKASGARLLLRLGYAFFEDLREILSSTVFDKRDLIFAHTILHTEFPGWAWCFRQFRQKLPKTFLLLRYSLAIGHRSKMERRWLPYVYRFPFRMIQGRKQPFVVTDSEDLAKEYQPLTSIPIRIVPIPLEANFSELLLHAQQRIVNPNNYRHLVYLGDVRQGKGFDLLPPLIEKLNTNSSAEIKITIHCGRPPEKIGNLVVKDAILRLQKFVERGNIQLIISNISRIAYLELLSSADVVLLPCRREYYMGQTSNVLAEAFAAGKPVIVPQDTWMARQVMETGAGALFESGNVESLLKATEEILKNLSKYREAAQKQREIWISYHNAERFVDEILGS